jgi:hypothetical protein
MNSKKVRLHIPIVGMQECLDTHDCCIGLGVSDKINGLHKSYFRFGYLIEVDYTITESQKGVLALAASGVGGWSLVYTNVTRKSDIIVIDNWGTILK